VSASNFLRNAFTFDQQSSMGFRSGVYGGRRARERPRRGCERERTLGFVGANVFEDDDVGGLQLRDARHPDLGPRFVDEDEISRVQGARPGSKTVAKRLNVGGGLLGRDEGLFFRVKPSRVSSLLIVDVLTASFARAISKRTNSGIVASGCSATSARSAFSPRPVNFRGLPPPCGFGSTEPVSRNRLTSRFTDARPTWNISAT
jgi:hypothetical protein